MCGSSWCLSEARICLKDQRTNLSPTIGVSLEDKRGNRQGGEKVQVARKQADSGAAWTVVRCQTWGSRFNSGLPTSRRCIRTPTHLLPPHSSRNSSGSAARPGIRQGEASGRKRRDKEIRHQSSSGRGRTRPLVPCHLRGFSFSGPYPQAGWWPVERRRPHRPSIDDARFEPCRTMRSKRKGRRFRRPVCTELASLDVSRSR